MKSKVANELDEVGDLLPEEQDELVLKLRYGIGLEQLAGVRSASEIRAIQRAPPDAPAPEPSPPVRSDAEIRARAAALGITSGRRGHWIGR